MDQTGTYVFDAKIDNRLAAGFQGEYWSTEGDNDTAITIKNITQKEAKAWPSFQYDSGRGNYEMQAMTLQPGESQMIDLKMLQMEKMPGANGEILPETATFGGMKLREEPGGRHFLIDAVVFNPKTATCGVCGYGCLYPQSLITIPGGMELIVGELSGALGVQANMCDGTHQTGWECTCDFSSGNSSVATINEFCTNYITGVGPGSTLANGTAVDVPGPHCGDQTLFLSCTVQVTPTVQITFDASGIPLCNTVPPPPGAAGFVCSAPMTAQGNPAGGTYSWSTTSSNVTLSGTNLQTVTVIGQSESTTQNSVIITVTYTLNRQQGTAQQSVTVQKPTFMEFDSIDYSRAKSDCLPGNAGWEKRIIWQAKDRFHSAMRFAMATWDTLSNSTPNSCSVPSQGIGTTPEEGLATDSSGKWPHKYGLCSPACVTGNCQVTGTQTYTVNGFQISLNLNYTMTCTSITVNGH